MKSKYKRLGDYIEEVDIRNRYGQTLELWGVSIDKKFIKSVANIIGTDLSKYKVVSKDCFVCSLMQVSRDEKIPVACWHKDNAVIVSPAYKVFRVKDCAILLPHFIELWFMRPEFDREASFYGVGGVRGSLEWEDFCDMQIPVPPIEEQQKIVDAYATIEKRIAIKKSLNENLEAQASTIYYSFVKNAETTHCGSIYEILSVINGTPFASDYFNCEQKGFPLVRIRDLSTCDPDVYTDEKIKNMEYVQRGDILIGMDGEFLPCIWFGKTGVLNQRVCKVIPAKNYIHPLFLYFTLKPILSELQRTQGGTTVIHLGKKDFDQMKCVTLSENLHRDFNKRMSPIFAQILLNYLEIFNLLKTKDVLLNFLSQ